MRLADIRIRTKLIFFFIMTGIIPLAIVGFIGTDLATKSMLKTSFEHLNTLQSIRKHQVEEAFEEKQIDLEGLAKSARVQMLANELEAYRKQSGTAGMASFNLTSSQYKKINDKYKGFFLEFAEQYNYTDLFVISATSGHVMLSSAQKSDLGTNLATGRFKSSVLAQIWLEVVRTEETVSLDFEPYEPSKGMESAFFGVPIYDDQSNLIAILAAQFSADFISEVLNSRQGMGKSGESYLMRWFKDSNRFELRSDLQTMGDGEIVVGYELDQVLDYWKDAVRAETKIGSGTYTDSAGEKVLIAYTHVDIADYEWFMVSKIDRNEVIAPVYYITKWGLLASALLVVCITICSWLFSTRFTRPIIDDADFAQEIAAGKFDRTLTLDQKDELGELASALNHMSLNLKEINWLKVGKEGLDDTLRGEHSPKLLAQKFLTFFVKHLDGQVGAFYAHQKGSLNLTASYAFTDRGDNFNKLSFGEGMVGQAAIEQKTIYFTNVDEDAPQIHFGVGSQVPNHFVIAPLVLEGKVFGVILVGSLTLFSEADRKFIDQNVENFAVLLEGAASRETIQQLLSKAQAQQKELHLVNEELEDQARELQESQTELQAQQEELRVTNEELEEQTKALKGSEKELQAQQEELRVTNEELEGRTKTLEKQKQALNKKTRDLVMARKDVEKKAEDLEVASQYKSEFLANMSHELRTPLNSILILSELFTKNRDNNLSDKQVESAKAINKSGVDLLSLINEILDLSKVEAGKVELVIEAISIASISSDINRVFKDVAEEKGIDFSIKIEDDLPEQIYTDSQRLQQVLRNLLTNGVKFTHEGEVSLHISRAEEKYLSQSGLKRDEAVCFSVKDDGIGIPKIRQVEIFEAFKQVDGSTSRTYGGTGLGLSISKELARLLGGSIHLESEEGKGSTFIVILPEKHASVKDRKSGAEKLAEQQGEPKVEISQESVASPRESVADPVNPQLPEGKSEVHDDRKRLTPEDKSLLIIEDDQKFVEILRDFAHERGFKCIVAENGETGLHFADFYKPSAIILDIGLPGIDGWEVMERLKEDVRLRHIPVHFMSAADSSLDAMRMGAVGFLSKPVTIDKVDEAFGKIENVISKPVRKLLIVEDDDIQRESIKQLVGDGGVETTTVATGKEAFDELARDKYDCLILDLGLDDMSGFELLEKIRGSKECATVPVIIYTGRDLSHEQEKELRKYTDSIIIKGVKSPERLLEESALFLHRVEENMPQSLKRVQKMNHNKEGVFTDKKVLLVDDDMRNVFALSAVLEEKGLDIVIARNGIEAIEKLSENSDVALVLMDIMMPKMDGHEAMTEIRKDTKHKNLPIIALTAKAMKGDRGKCIESGANDYMAKPVNTDKLLSMLRVWLY